MKALFTVQFLQFAFVGILNTAVDLATLNILIMVFGINEVGYRYSIFKGVSFIVAVFHSFLWNKYWVFKHHSDKRHTLYERSSFFIVSAVGLVINVFVAHSVVFLTSRIFPVVSLSLLANGGALLGSGIALVWNFLAYKSLVFKQ